MNKVVDLYIPGGKELLLVAKLATVGYVAKAGFTLDAAEDIKLAVEEALGAVNGERLHLQMAADKENVLITIEGEGTCLPDETEQEVVRCVLESMMDSVEIEAGGETTAIRMKKSLIGGAR